MSVFGRIVPPPRDWCAAGSSAKRWSIAVLAAALLAAAGPARGQAGGADSSLVTPGAAVTPDAVRGELGADPLSTLPPPATDRVYLHVFLAFAFAWALIFGYTVLLNRRIAAAEREVGRLTEPGA